MYLSFGLLASFAILEVSLAISFDLTDIINDFRGCFDFLGIIYSGLTNIGNLYIVKKSNDTPPPDGNKAK